MNHVFAGERSSSGSSWMTLVLVTGEEGGCSFILRVDFFFFTPCVGAGQTTQSAVKARVAVSSGDAADTGKRWRRSGQVMQS